MKNIDEHIDLIERYLYDDLTQEELEEFNDLLRQDTEFNKLFYEMDHLLDGIRRSARKTTVEEKLTNLEKSLPATDSESKKSKDKPVIPLFGYNSKVGKTVMVTFSTMVNNRYRTAIAAAFTLLIVATVILFNINSNGSPAAIFADHFVPFENQGSHNVRGNNEKSENTDQMMIREALVKYDNGDYMGAVEIFDRIEVNESNKYQVWLYGGNAYLHEGQVEKAKLMFESIIDEDAGYVIQAKWYLSLCHIKNGEIEKAKPLLEDIKNEEKSSKSKEAGNILSRL